VLCGVAENTAKIHDYPSNGRHRCWSLGVAVGFGQMSPLHRTEPSQLITTFWGNQVAGGFSQLRLLPKTRLTNWPPTPLTTAWATPSWLTWSLSRDRWHQLWKMHF